MEPAESDTDLAAGGTQYRLRTIYLSLFTDLGVPARLSTVINDLGITTPTPIQQATLPDALAGRDVLGRGRTGSGKTLAFLLPLVARLADGPRPRSRAPRGLILAPTRELAGQIDAVLKPLAKAAGLTSQTVYGGVGQGPQVTALRRGVDIVVACPGRLEDLIAQRHCSLSAVQVTVLDEADHMADLGFLPAVSRLLEATPKDGQRMLFSATLDKAVNSLVRRFLSDPAVHEADSAQSPVSTMTHHVLHVDLDARLEILTDLITAPGRCVVFTRTKRGAKTLTTRLQRAGVDVVELHGNLAQNARTRNMDAFHSGRATVLVATDIAARGIHVDDVRLVIHADPPADHKAYLHRSGRTARAGNAGTVVTIVTHSQIREVETLTRAAGIKATLTRVTSVGHPLLLELAPGERSATGVIEAEARTPAPRRGEPRPDGRQASGRSRGGRGRGRGPERHPLRDRHDHDQRARTHRRASSCRCFRFRLRSRAQRRVLQFRAALTSTAERAGSMRLNIEQHVVESRVHVVITGVIDWSTLDQFREALRDLVSGPHPDIELDVSGLVSWSHEARILLVRAASRARLQGGDLVVSEMKAVPRWEADGSMLPERPPPALAGYRYRGQGEEHPSRPGKPMSARLRLVPPLPQDSLIQT